MTAGAASGAGPGTLRDQELVEHCCEVMHDAYEAAAVGAGWETQERSRKPWADVPEANKVTMRAAVRALLADALLAGVLADHEGASAAVEALVSALDRTEHNMYLAVEGKPVRDMSENLVENARARLAATRAALGGQEGAQEGDVKPV